jgi:outer membrane protein assembly factor BamB
MVAPHRPPVAVSGEVAVLGEVPAWDMVATANRVIVIDEGFATATGLDAATGTRAWHAQIETEALGRHSLHVTPSGLLEWTANTLHALDPATGKELATNRAPYNGEDWNDGGCGLHVERGVCAFHCQCSYQVIDCATGKAVGKRYDKTYVEFFAEGQPTSGGCWGSGSSTIGRVGDLALFSTEDIADPASASRSHASIGGGASITAAIDLGTGVEAWRTLLGASSMASRTGVSPDGKTCWLVGANDAVLVIDCATGAPLWQTEAAAAPAARFYTSFVAPHALFELRDSRATLYDERTGARRWRVTLPAGTIGWPRKVDQELDWRVEDVTAIAILDPIKGTTLATIPRPKAAGMTPDHRGGVLLAGDQLEHYDAAGKRVARAALANAGLMLGSDYAIAVMPRELVVLALSDLHEVGRIPGTYQRIIVEGPLGAHRAALFEYAGKAPGRAVVVRLGP